MPCMKVQSTYNCMMFGSAGSSVNDSGTPKRANLHCYEGLTSAGDEPAAPPPSAIPPWPRMWPAGRVRLIARSRRFKGRGRRPASLAGAATAAALPCPAVPGGREDRAGREGSERHVRSLLPGDSGINGY